jgi:hypothetical protein
LDIRAQTDQVIAAVVHNLLDGNQTLGQPVDRGLPLAALEVMRPDGHLEEDPRERHFVAHGFEEEILEELRGIEVVVGVEQFHTGEESGIVGDVHPPRYNAAILG